MSGAVLRVPWRCPLCGDVLSILAQVDSVEDAPAPEGFTALAVGAVVVPDSAADLRAHARDVHGIVDS